MKKLLGLSFIAVLGGLIIFSTPIRAQEEVKTEKKIRIKTVKDENGKKVVTDTTIVVEGDIHDLDLEKYGIIGEGEDIDVMVDVIMDGDDVKGNKKVMVFTTDGHHESDGEHEVRIIKSGKGGTTKVVTWTDEDGNEMTFDIEVEMDEVMRDLEKAHREMEIEMEVIDGEHIIVMKELEALADLEELHELKELENMQFKFIEAPHSPHHGNFFIEECSQVTDVELRDAGIKNKPDRLEADEIDIAIDGGVVDLSFKLKAEANPKVIVYNIYGDKVFNGKPELMNGSYKLKMDLSAKQHGTYYLQVVSGNSSFTERLKL